MTEVVAPRSVFRREMRFDGTVQDGALSVTAHLDDDDHDFTVAMEITVPEHMLRRIEVSYRRAPFGECFREGGVALQALAGQPVGLDFKKRAREVLGRGHGCLHLRSVMTAFADYLSIMLYANHLGVLDTEMDPVERYHRSYAFMQNRCPAFVLGPDPATERLVLPREPQ